MKNSVKQAALRGTHDREPGRRRNEPGGGTSLGRGLRLPRHTKEITGTVKKFDYTNPHTWVWVDVPNESGRRRYVGRRRDEPELSEPARLDAQHS